MKKLLVILLTLALVGVTLCVEGQAQTRTPDDELTMIDLLLARPLGVAAGIVGTGFFIISLPFTIPAKSVDKAAKMFISDPFHFSFSRPFPDESLDFK
ncbi:MAG: hypothetical protein A2156_12915 [Deltaproteobacteria bacterium RBG_16_48_10]|nr:MAG: hypothetical protein A2156_12915 [Deltaproteobacteria bacterium RBG_16_48_10]